MLSLDTPLRDLDGLCLQGFWQLPVTKDFEYQPEYYIGQRVLHCTKHPLGEILHPVKVFGVMWTGNSWEYMVSLPKQHPQFIEEDCECLWLNEWQIEPI